MAIITWTLAVVAGPGARLWFLSDRSHLRFTVENLVFEQHKLFRMYLVVATAS